jgi:transketolase
MAVATTIGQGVDVRELAQQLRVDSIRASTEAGSGHPTSSMSAADLLAVLMAKYLHYDFDAPKDPRNDHLIFSKGHASPLIYSVFKAAGAITDAELMTLRKFGSRLQGHPTPVLPWVDVATGSLGQGLPIGVGIALAGRYLDRLPYRVWVVLGDSEMAEGSQWEAFDHAGNRMLGNLIGILDMNRLGQRGPTELGWNGAAYAARARAFGWRAIEIDGHNLEQIDRAYAEATADDSQPTLIVAQTMKGRGVSFLEDKEGWHGKALPRDQAVQAIAELGGERHIVVAVHKPEGGAAPAAPAAAGKLELPTYQKGDSVATRKAYGDALKALGGARGDVVALDGEVSNSTFAEEFAKAYPDRYFEMYIAEQQLVAAAVGMSVRGRVPFASTFAAFMTRAYDFIRMAAISQANIRLCGSHAGVSIGEDGPSQMALEDLAMMRAVCGSTVLYPCDGNQTAHLVAQMADRQGISFLRTTREKTDVLYDPGESFPIGGSKVLRSSQNDQVAVIAAGITVREALAAHEQLGQQGIAVRVIDAYSVKPIDEATLRQAARDTGGRLVVVEDHWSEGGLGDAVLAAFAGDEGDLPGANPPRVVKLAVTTMPGSGKPDELLDAAGISARHIVAAVTKLTARHA